MSAGSRRVHSVPINPLREHQMLTSNTLLFDTSFAFSGEGGGPRRSAQIAELLSVAGFDVVRCRLTADDSIGQRILRGAKYRLRSSLSATISLATLRAIGFASQAYDRAFNAHVGPRLIIQERTHGVGRIGSEMARSRSFRTLAVPQNLESLVPGQRDSLSGLSGMRGLAAELFELSRSDAVFCIAKEEQWLLNVNGIDAHYLPYFPIESWEIDLLSIRSRRAPSAPRRFLLLGGVANPPVLAGMIELIGEIAPIARTLNVELHVAGHSTERHLAHLANDAVTIHGTVTEAALATLMAECTAAVVFQRQGCGALTRIPELLLAGIPVLSNPNAARSAFHYDGVHTFHSYEELRALMAGDLPIPTVPVRPIAEESHFVRVVQLLAAQALPST